MYHLQNLKHVNLILGSFTNGASATGSFDTLGYDEVLVSVKTSTSNATDGNFSTCTLAESDDNTTFTNITAFVGDTAWTIPNADTSSVQLFALHCGKTGGRKRYMKLTVVPVTTQVLSATAFLGRARELPNNTTEQGTVASVNG